MRWIALLAVASFAVGGCSLRLPTQYVDREVRVVRLHRGEPAPERGWWLSDEAFAALLDRARRAPPAW